MLPSYMMSRGHIRSRAGSSKAKEKKVALATAMASADFLAPEAQVFGAINPSNGRSEQDGVVVGQATPRTWWREQHTTTTRSAGEPQHGARLKPEGGDQKHRRQQVARTMTHSGAWRLGTKATSVYRCLTCSSRRFLTFESRRLCERAHTHTHTHTHPPSPSLFTHTHVNACVACALTHARTHAHTHSLARSLTHRHTLIHSFTHRLHKKLPMGVDNRRSCRGESRARETEMLGLSDRARQWLAVSEQMLEQLVRQGVRLESSPLREPRL